MKRPLGDLAHTRSAPLGAGANIAVVAWRPEDYETLSRELTSARVRALLETLIAGPIERHEIPNLHAINFVLGELRSGTHVNTLGSALLRLELETERPRS